MAYRREVAASGTPEPGFEVELNSGSRMPFRCTSTRRTGRPRTAASGTGWTAASCTRAAALLGPPAPEVFADLTPADLRRLLVDALSWWLALPTPPADEPAPGTEDAVLGACRSLVRHRDGVWLAKVAAGQRLIDAGDPAAVIPQALAARHGGTPPAARRPGPSSNGSAPRSPAVRSRGTEPPRAGPGWDGRTRHPRPRSRTPRPHPSVCPARSARRSRAGRCTGNPRRSSRWSRRPRPQRARAGVELAGRCRTGPSATTPATNGVAALVPPITSQPAAGRYKVGITRRDWPNWTLGAGGHPDRRTGPYGVRFGAQSRPCQVAMSTSLPSASASAHQDGALSKRFTWAALARARGRRGQRGGHRHLAGPGPSAEPHTVRPGPTVGVSACAEGPGCASRAG